MTPEDVERLRSCTDHLVRINTSNDERLIVKLIMMQDEYQDFICDVIETTHPERYSRPITSSAYTISYDIVVSFERIG